MIKLYYSWYSICSEKVLICLFEKGLLFESEQVDLFKFEQVRDEYLSINPNGKVPTLVHDDNILIESTLINEFLDDNYPKVRLIPDNPHQRFEMRTWVHYAQENMFPSAGLISQVHFVAEELKSRWPKEELERLIGKKVSKIGAAKQLKAVTDGVDSEDFENANDKFADAIDLMEAALEQNGPWLVGDYSLADIAVAPNLYRMHCLGMENFWKDHHPRVTDWYERLTAREAFQKTYEFSPPTAPE